ncbi:carboxypeptidase-like regulatory domain-containing protein [Prevotella sp. OH937_COT-195]|uniref:carboxypeptidase-like regulatory domain-containing protein n=1 Tax=Prevotella sp. OH937_COT-195 TaxID=2491051 RepID=UPI0013159226|nr:carboxypeptidase-like regulatory domain-containing protein [Prevotella sp. OH937_COT-195]
MFLFFFLCSVQICYGQGFYIKGTLKDASTLNPVEAAQVILLRDSTIMPKYHTLSSLDGKFTLENIPASSYRLQISCMGYKQTQISIIELTKNIDLGEVFVEEKPMELSEVTVSATVQSKADRWVYYPSDVIKKQGVDAYDILQRMNLPDLRFDMINHSLSSLKQGTLQIRINGVLSQQSDLIALQPQDIAKIEYVDNPGIAYGEGVSAVILIKTKQQYEGLQGGSRLLSAVTTNMGSAYAYFKWIGKVDFLNLKINGQYQDVRGIYANNTQKFNYPTSAMTLNSVGEDGRSKHWNGDIQLDYNHSIDNRNSFFNATVKYSGLWQPKNNSVGNVWKNDVPTFTEILSRKNKTHNIMLEFYLDKSFSNKSNLLASLTGTHITSNYNRWYNKEYTNNSLSKYESAYDVNGKHHSIIGEIIYKYPLTECHWLTVGTYERYSHTDNIYTMTESVNPISLLNFNSYNYLEFSGAFGKLSYSLGGGYSFYRIKNNSILSQYHFFRPSLSLSIPLLKKFRLQYHLNINPQEPTLAMRSDFSQTISEYEISKGNPYLKPYQSYSNQVSLSFRRTDTFLSLTAYLQYNKHPFTNNPPYYDPKIDKFVYTISNQKSFTHTQIRMYASQKLFSQALNLSGYLTLNRYINDGLKFSTSYTGLLGGLTISYDQPKWGVLASYRTAISYMFNETKTRMAPNLQLSAYYNIHRIRCSISINNPFMNPVNTIEVNSKAIQGQTHKYQKYNSNLVTIAFSYNFRIGKTRNPQKQINNTDTDNGVVR